MTTMADVARAAGVVGSTVSHVLNGTRKVNEDTRRRVEEAIIATGYQRNSVARSLAAGRTEVIGFTVPVRTNPYILDLVKSVEIAASTAGYTLMFSDTYDDSQLEGRAVAKFLQHRVDGIIMAPGLEAESQAIPRILASQTPLVLIDRAIPNVLCDQVVVDNETSAYDMTAHLVGHGYRSIAVVLGHPGIWPTDQRYLGFARAMSEAGMNREPSLELLGDANELTAERAIAAMYADGRRPDAIFALNNAMTLGAMRALRSLNISVPDDVALVSFDDFPWADLFQPRLTAIAQDASALGGRAIDLLIDRIRDPQRPPEQVVLPAVLHVRDSCGAH